MKQVCMAFLALVCFAGLSPAPLSAQSGRDGGGGSARVSPADGELPLWRVALFSSGVGYFERAGEVSGTEAAPAELTLSFNHDAVNDALKSLAISDPVSASPSVRYPSEGTLFRTLSFPAGLADESGAAGILNSLRGEEITVSAPNAVSGRIVGVEYRDAALGNGAAREAWLTLLTAEGVRALAVKDIASFAFTDPRITAGLNKALDLIAASRNSDTRALVVSLPGTGKRAVRVSYVIPVPVWKVSYRLDLSGEKPLFQGWAIVDNDSDDDWREVRLSLIAGRPVSFIQQLYPPYRTARPVLPLAIAGAAEAQARDSGWAADEARTARAETDAAGEEAPVNQAVRMKSYAPAPEPAPAVPALAGGAAMRTAADAASGGQFEFTLPRPVTLERRQSAMLPLVEGTVAAEKTLVLSGAKLSGYGGGEVNPEISAEITNTTGMRLPAGPVTVYDGGVYAGDALVNFLSENEKRIISWGEDLAVTASADSAYSRNIAGVTVSGGVMVINRKRNWEKTYTIRNGSGDDKKLIIEHPVTAGRKLTQPASYRERTGDVYRFALGLKAKETVRFTVKEEEPLSERVVLADLAPLGARSFAAYIADGEIPAKVKSALEKAAALKNTADEAASSLTELEARGARLAAEQDRIRKNLEAAGNQTPQGQDYLKRLAALDSGIDSVNAQTDAARDAAFAAQKAYRGYLAGLEL
ncbi:MAG: DUF4139 domain-containing protein [Treponematales bacterium]